jgi:hypothetical protein
MHGSTAVALRKYPGNDYSGKYILYCLRATRKGPQEETSNCVEDIYAGLPPYQRVIQASEKCGMLARMLGCGRSRTSAEIVQAMNKLSL